MSITDLPTISPLSTKIDGSFPAAPADFFRPDLFGQVARLIWEKPDAVLADLADASPRTARDWLSGRVEPPNIIVVTVMAAIFGRR